MSSPGFLRTVGNQPFQPPKPEPDPFVETETMAGVSREQLWRVIQAAMGFEESSRGRWDIDAFEMARERLVEQLWDLPRVAFGTMKWAWARDEGFRVGSPHAGQRDVFELKEEISGLGSILGRDSAVDRVGASAAREALQWALGMKIASPLERYVTAAPPVDPGVDGAQGRWPVRARAEGRGAGAGAAAGACRAAGRGGRRLRPAPG